MRINREKEKFYQLLNLIDDWYTNAEWYIEDWDDDEEAIFPEDSKGFVKEVTDYFNKHGWEETVEWFIGKDLEIFVAYAEENFRIIYVEPTVQLEIPLQEVSGDLHNHRNTGLDSGP